MATIFKQSMASAFIQFQPGRELHYLGDCVDLESISNPRVGGIELIQCRNRRGDGYKTVGTRKTPPGTIEITLSEIESNVVSWLERVNCPFTLYALQRTCGEAGVAKNYERAAAVTHVEITDDVKTQLLHHIDDNETMREWTLVGSPPRLDAWSVNVSRNTTTEAQDITCIAAPGNIFCDDDCGAYTLPCDVIYAGARAGAGVSANVLVSTDGGSTWAALATDPFGADEDILAISVFEISKGVNRILVAREFVLATPMEVAYSDDNGATWISVNVGTTNAEGIVGNKSVSFIDSEHIWMTTIEGNVYFSYDGGETWTVQGSAITASGGASMNAISFANEDEGVAVGDGDVLILTVDGGLHWTVGTATGSGDDLLAVQCFNRNRFLVGTDSVAGSSLLMTFNSGDAWEAKTFTGSSLESVADVTFFNSNFGFMLTNTAAPVGSIHRTIDGGHSWSELGTIANSGFNSVIACGNNEGYFVGKVNAATGFIGSIA